MNNLTTELSYKDALAKISRDLPVTMIGERINPTGRKKVLAALQAGDFSIVRDDAIQQVAAGAQVLDVNAGVPGADEPALLTRVIQEVLSVADIPLCIDTANSQALAAALEIYEGKALINSVNGERKSLDRVLPIAREHNAAIIALCMNDDGIPATPEGRLAVAADIVNEAAKHNIPLEDIVVDPLAMTMGADHMAGSITLETIELVANEFGVNMTMGASNISFGLPDRKYVNAAFLAMAIQAGITCPITNPLVTEIRTTVLAADLAQGKDDYATNWIKAYRARRTD